MVCLESFKNYVTGWLKGQLKTSLGGYFCWLCPCHPLVGLPSEWLLEGQQDAHGTLVLGEPFSGDCSRVRILQYRHQAFLIQTSIFLKETFSLLMLPHFEVFSPCKLRCILRQPQILKQMFWLLVEIVLSLQGKYLNPTGFWKLLYPSHYSSS